MEKHVIGMQYQELLHNINITTVLHSIYYSLITKGKKIRVEINVNVTEYFSNP